MSDSSIWMCAGCKVVVLAKNNPGDCGKCKAPVFVKIEGSEGAHLEEAKKPAAVKIPERKDICIGGTPGFYDSYCSGCGEKGRGSGGQYSHVCQRCKDNDFRKQLRRVQNEFYGP